MQKKYGFKNQRFPTGCLKKIAEITGLNRIKLSGWLGGSRRVFPGIGKILISSFNDLGITTTQRDWTKNLPKIRKAIIKWHNK